MAPWLTELRSVWVGSGLRTEHGLQFDQTAGEVVEVDDLAVGVSSDQHLIQLVVEFEP